MNKLILLVGLIMLLLNGCRNIEQEFTWHCDKIQCGSIILINSNITCGNYWVWDYKCNMINCTKPVICKND